MAEIIFLSNVRLSFPQLVEARSSVQPSAENPNPTKKFSADFLINADNPALSQFMAEYGKLALEKWGDNANAIMQLIQNDRRNRCYGNGAERVNTKTFKVYDGYDGKVFIGASSTNPPQMIQADGKAADPANIMAYQAVARKMYGGCYVNAAVRPWLQDNKHGRAVRCELIAVQFFTDGEAFGEGSPDATGLFGTVAGTTTASAAPAGMPPLPSFMQAG